MPEANYQVVSPLLTLDENNPYARNQQQAIVEIDSEPPISSDAGFFHQATQVDLGV